MADLGPSATEQQAEVTSRGSLLTISEDGSVSCDSEKLSDHVVARSELLWSMKDTAGSATVPIDAPSFQAWRLYHEGKPDVSASELASVLEAALFLDDKQSAAQTSRQVAAIIRRAYRQDLRSTASTSNGTLCFPHHPTTTAGAALKYVFLGIRHTTAASVSAIVPHLTLCEALACPAPFPTLAVSHFLEDTSGHLDLSPPRVPTHSRPLLHRLCTSLAPLLTTLAPSITSLSVPAAALRGSGQLPLLPIVSLLGHVTSLTITPEPPQPATPNAAHTNLSSAALHTLLQHLSPAALRSISAPAPLSPCPAAADVFEVLSTFTGLTSLTIGLLAHPVRAHFTAMASLPSLKRLHLTHAPRAVLALGPVRLAPTLTRLHVVGNSAAARHILASSALSFNAPLPQTLLDIGAEPRSEFPGCAVTAAENRTIKNKFDTLVQMPRRSLLLPLGTTNPDDLSPSTLTTLHRLAVNVPNADALTRHLPALPCLRSLILYLPTLVTQIPALDTANLPALRHVRIVLAPSLSVHQRELHGARAFATALLHGIPSLHTLEAIHLGDVSEEALAPMCTVPQRIDGFERATPLRTEAGDWSGFDEDGEESDVAEVAGDGGSRRSAGDARSHLVAASAQLHTVRVSRCLLGGDLTEALQMAAGTGALRTLSVLSSEAPSSTACASPSGVPCSHDLRFLSTVTSLRRLSVEGQQSACMLLQALTPLRGLTALQLCGTEASPQAACEAGSRLAQLTALQHLNLNVVWQGSNSLAAAHACTGTCAGARAADDDDEAYAAVESGFWAGLWAAAMELPVHRGARASFRKGCTCVAEML